jgi:protein TonB
MSVNTRGTASIYCRFAPPGEPLVVRIQADALNRLHQRVLGAKPVRRETAGFLLGTLDGASRGGSDSLLAIENFAVVRPECQRGRLFSYSQADPDILQDQLLSYKGEIESIGFFRVNFRNEPGPTHEDITLMMDHFGPGKVLLLINGSGKRCSGTFYALSAHDPSAVRASYPIFLDGAAVPAERSPEAPAAAVAPFETGSLDFMPEESGQHVRRPVHFLKHLSAAQVGLVLAGIAILGLGAIQYRTLKLLDQQRQEAPKTSGGLDLRMERSSGENQWRLAWNRSSNAIRTAGKGHVSILDGYLRKELDLTAADLQSGGIIYSFSPVSEDVSFRLEVFDLQAGRAVSESIRVLASPWPASAAAMYPGSEFPGGSREGIPRDTRPRRADARVTGGSADRTGQPQSSVSTQASAEAAGTPTRRPFTPPSRNAEPVVVSRSINDLPPALELNTASAAGSMAPFAAPAAAPPPPSAAPAQVAPSGPAGSVGPAAVTPSRLSASSATGAPPAVEPPTLLHKTDPQYPRLASQMRIVGTVRVEFTVGTDGRVRDPRALSGPTLLRDAAVDAVKSWTYKPARVNGHSVQAPTTIDVKFGYR